VIRGAVAAGQRSRCSRYLRSDNESEFISRAKFRDECRGMQWFQNRTEARLVIEAWREKYNTVRPHSSLGDLTPAEFAERVQSTQQTMAVF
jgi:transposase InsO family protein